MRCKSIFTFGIFAAVVLFLCACPALGIVEFKDGLTHDIDYTVGDNVYVDYQAPAMYTTVNWLYGASLSGSYVLCGYEHSRINVLGGSINNFDIWGSSQVNISGGEIKYWLSSLESSRVDMSGGKINWLESLGSSQVDISGGEIDWLESYDSSQVNISGGSMGSDLVLWDESLIRIFGSDFAINGHTVGLGELNSVYGGDPFDEPLRRLTGTLVSGERINNYFYIGNDARIVLIPEPASVILLGLGGLTLRKRRK